MKRKDYQILSEILDSVEELLRCSGNVPDDDRVSSLRSLRRETMLFERDCRESSLNVSLRKQRAKDLFRKILSAHPKLWS